MSIDNLYDFFKKINYKRILPALFCPVLLLCTSISGYAYTGNNFNFFPLVFSSGTDGSLPALTVYDLDSNVVISTLSTGISSDNVYSFSNSNFYPISHISINNNNGFFIYPYTPDLKDYYFLGSFYSVDTNKGRFSFIPDSVCLTSFDSWNDDYIDYFLSDIDTFVIDDVEKIGFSFFGKIPHMEFSSIISVQLSSSSDIHAFGSDVKFQGLIISVDKDSSIEQVSSLIQAINNQTIQQNNNFNNFMGSGSQFGGTTSGILSGNDELSGFIDDYTEVEQSMYDKFTENQTAVSGNFSGWSWGSLSTAVDWTSDYLNRIYDNSGDFRTMFMYPILAGIALIFIGRQGLTAYVRSRREK